MPLIATLSGRPVPAEAFFLYSLPIPPHKYAALPGARRKHPLFCHPKSVGGIGFGGGADTSKWAGDKVVKSAVLDEVEEWQGATKLPPSKENHDDDDGPSGYLARPILNTLLCLRIIWHLLALNCSQFFFWLTEACISVCWMKRDEATKTPLIQSLGNLDHDNLHTKILNMFPYELDSFQKKAIRVILSGKSVVVCAPTGNQAWHTVLGQR